MINMIISFADKETAAIFAGYAVRKLPLDMQQTARRKLKQLDAARMIDELLIPPGNRLEALKGDRKGQWSIRINDQWRICFRWEDGNAENVQIVDYHKG
jgi:proteic killer suppression protein